MFARRLDDRIRNLTSAIAMVAPESPKAQIMIEQLKADLSEYFERERNPPYDVEKRSDRLQVSTSSGLQH